MLRVCHVIASINARTGGPAVSVTRLAAAQAKKGAAVKLWTLEYSGLGTQEPAPGVEVVSSQANALTRWFRGFTPMAGARLGRGCGEIDLIHNHGLWMFPNLYARQAARRCRAPLVISPRGMLEAWALRRSRWKKWVVWHAFERSNLQQAALFHATSGTEAQAIRRLGFKQPIATIGNGVDIPDLENAPAGGRLISSFPELRGKRWLLFLSRLHPVKGIDVLLDCWGRLYERFPDWHLVVAGPVFANYDVELNDIVKKSGSQHRVTFTGMLKGADKSAAMANSDLFVMPSHSESFGLVIAEALAHSLPVITTRQTPWPEIASRGCGWWIDDVHDRLTEALIEAMSCEPAKLKKMGATGRDWMILDYSWETVADRMMTAYRWILDEGEKPDFIAV